MALGFRLFLAKTTFKETHRNPKVKVLDEDTRVLNMSDTSNRKPDGDFEGSWTQYWMAFSGEETLRCSVCGKLLWNKENKKSVEACKKLIRPHEIYNHVEGRDEKETIDDYESQGGHVKLNDMIYITPLCREHNKKEVGDSIKLKAGSVLIEEVDPIIEKE